MAISATANTPPAIPEINSGNRPSAPYRNPAHNPAASTANPLAPPSAFLHIGPTRDEIHALPTPSVQPVNTQ